MPETIELIVADIDGCLTAGGRSLFDFQVFEALRSYQRQARTDPTVPPLVLNTGRPLPYTIAMCQALDLTLPSLSECGSVLWIPKQRNFAVHPSYTPELRQHTRELMHRAEEELAGASPCRITVEAGKFCQVTFLAVPPCTLEDVIPEIEAFAERHHERYAIDRTHAVVNLLPHGIDKGAGLRWLAEVTGVPLSGMAGIGDTTSDWAFLAHCGISACPGNGTAFLKENCTWSLAAEAPEAMLELYEKVVEHNRRLSPGTAAEGARKGA